MTGSSLAPFIIPITGILGLAVWLILVFYSERLWRAGGDPAGGHDSPGHAVLAAALPPESAVVGGVER